MVSLPSQFIIAMVAYAFNERMARRIDYLTERFHVLRREDQRWISGRLDEPVTMAKDDGHCSLAVTRAATSRSIAGRLESSSRVSQHSRQETANLPPIVDTTDTPACSEAHDARRLGAQGRLVIVV
jgi:hypothetical protein